MPLAGLMLLAALVGAALGQEEGSEPGDGEDRGGYETGSERLEVPTDAEGGGRDSGGGGGDSGSGSDGGRRAGPGRLNRAERDEARRNRGGGTSGQAPSWHPKKSRQAARPDAPTSDVDAADAAADAADADDADADTVIPDDVQPAVRPDENGAAGEPGDLEEKNNDAASEAEETEEAKEPADAPDTATDSTDATDTDTAATETDTDASAGATDADTAAVVLDETQPATEEENQEPEKPIGAVTAAVATSPRTVHTEEDDPDAVVAGSNSTNRLPPHRISWSPNVRISCCGRRGEHFFSILHFFLPGE